MVWLLKWVMMGRWRLYAVIAGLIFLRGLYLVVKKIYDSLAEHR